MNKMCVITLILLLTIGFAVPYYSIVEYLRIRRSGKSSEPARENKVHEIKTLKRKERSMRVHVMGGGNENGRKE